MKQLVSIIVPVFNVEKYLSRCVISLLNQTYSNVEIILVDDGSTDNSGRICDEFANSHSTVFSIHKKNGGLSSARNTGIEICHGDYVSFVDSDDYIEHNMIEVMLRSCVVNGSLLSCCGRFDIYEYMGTKQIGLCPKRNETIDSKEAIRRLLRWNNLDSSSCDKMFHKSLFDDVRFPEGRISEDVAVMYKIFSKSKKISLVSMPLYNYCHRNNSITTSSFNYNKLDIMKNVEEIQAFIANNCPDLTNDFLYFKCTEYSHLLFLLSFVEKKPKSVVNKLIKEIKTCRTVFNCFDRKKRRRLSLMSSRFGYFVFSMAKKGHA